MGAGDGAVEGVQRKTIFKAFRFHLFGPLGVTTHQDAVENSHTISRDLTSDESLQHAASLRQRPVNAFEP